MSRARLLWLLLTVGGSGCIRSPAPVDPGALAGRITAPSPVAGPPGLAADRAPEGQASPPAPALPGNEPLTLDAAKDLADSVNPQLNRIRQTVDRAAAEERVVFADFLPAVALSQEFDAVTSRAGFVGMKEGRRFVQLPIRGYGPGTQDFQVLDLELRYTVFEFGKRLARHDQAVLRW
ncbi:MAG TPA: TolC family protein, partial [Gemmataceae bacterium]|nr:TolC family protein [Gemmataceae bacterium]